MKKVISESQNAFLSGRNIFDGVVVVNEVIDMASRLKTKGLIFKVDFQKAYDTVNWGYLDYMFMRMGFGEKWRQWMRVCVSSNSISVLMNGSPTGGFIAQKGIKEGDPLAPFLFLIAAEGLAGLVRKGEESNNLTGFKVSSSLSISMLQFVDDTIFLCDGKDKSVRCLKTILRCFEMVLGLKVNFAKSSVVGLNMEDCVIKEISSFLACKVVSVPFKFLGVPVGANPRRASTWQPIIESIKSRLSHWRSMKLSIGGRVALINSVLSSLPLYLFSMFKAPRKVIEEIQRLQRKFLWGGDGENKKMAWVKWEQICLPEDKGGLGIKDLYAFNLSLVAKWRWRMLSENDEPLWKRVLQARYGNYEEWLKGSIQQRSWRKTSLWWRDLQLLGEESRLGSEWFQNVVKKRMGDGASVKLWTDTWTGTETLSELFPSLLMHCGDREASVKEMGYWDREYWRWDIKWSVSLPVTEAGNVAALSDILRAVEPRRNTADKWVWLLNSAGGFSVKECYGWLLENLREALVNRSEIVEACKVLWNNDLPSKILVFCWRLLWNKLPTRDNLYNRGIISSPQDRRCVLCLEEYETCTHLFCRCSVTNMIWSAVSTWMGVGVVTDGEVVATFQQFGDLIKGAKAKKVKHLIWAATMWHIWLARNKSNFKGEAVNVNSIVLAVINTSWGWFIARRGRNSGLLYSNWCVSPLGCISSL